MSWAEDRARMEHDIHARMIRHGVLGLRRHPSGKQFRVAMSVLLAASGLWWRGRRNGRDLRVNAIDLAVEGLPNVLDGFTLLFLSDLHVGVLPENLDAAIRLSADLDFDLVLLGGDYQSFAKPHEARTLELLEPLISALKARTQVLGVLGNHDRHALAEGLRRLGVTMLVNDHWTMERRGARMVVTGLDDVFSFHTPRADAALKAAPPGDLRLALVHSPDMACVAADAGFNLYLAGHTHGGQVSLPGGRPIWTACDRHHRLASGVWRYGGMVGYTSTGLGASDPPIRINTRPEMALLTLRRAASP